MKSIIFSTEMVKAILDARKTMTRRLAGLKKINNKPDDWLPVRRDQIVNINANIFIFHNKNRTEPDGESIAEFIRCPYGQVGDRLWVRETWFENSFIPQDKHGLVYLADGEFIEQFPEDYIGAKWSSPRFMPRWASRIDLEITGIRAERLQEISIGDAEADTGIKFNPIKDFSPEDCLSRFESLWDSLNAKRGYGWETNPWVWVITFKVAKQ